MEQDRFAHRAGRVVALIRPGDAVASSMGWEAEGGTVHMVDGLSSEVPMNLSSGTVQGGKRPGDVEMLVG
jgi:hypothetical protein